MIQVRPNGKSVRVIGYGYDDYPLGSVVEGIVVDPNEVAKALQPLLKQMTYGKIRAGRVATCLPSGKIFTRVLDLPKLNPSDLEAAVRLEVEQYVPVPLADLYIDYDIVDERGERVNVLMVAAPRSIVDSYIKLFDTLGLELAFIEPSLTAVTRAITASQPMDKATLVADFGSLSIDIAVVDKVVRFTDTLQFGGEKITEALMQGLKLSREDANRVKYKIGLNKSDMQAKVQAVLKQPLQTVSSEFKRVIKYYNALDEGRRRIEQIVIAGGNASMPGLTTYLAEDIGLPVTLANPWEGLALENIQHVSKLDAPMYTTAIGLALLQESEA
jgi:type IV pilus assembly protein PilM